jgi:hemin uptake protein HemP
MRATSQGAANVVGSGGLMGDPYTGLAWPQRIESAELFDGSSEIVIVHQTKEYSLRITRKGKLILTK